jgi:DNA-binding LacI/PurR family transcriptional regulator
VISFGLAHDGHQGPADLARQRHAQYPVTRARLAGYAAALRDAGIEWTDVPVYECPGSGLELGRSAALALLESEPRPTALLATSDELALGAIEAAHRLAIPVPDQLSVAGFDDVLAARHHSPALTTVSQDHEQKGRLATGLLLDQLAGNPSSGTHLLPHDLVVRASTGRAPAPT